jgi:hypothetical protein
MWWKFGLCPGQWMKACAIAFPLTLPPRIFAPHFPRQSQHRKRGKAWKSANSEFVMDKLSLRSQYKQQ